LYGCETWSLTLTEERRLTVFGKRVLRKIAEPMRDEVTGEWGGLYKTVSLVLCTPHQIFGRSNKKE
jgi:hypothetical protein